MESQGSSVGNRNGAKYWTTDVGVLRIFLFAVQIGSGVHPAGGLLRGDKTTDV